MCATIHIPNPIKASFSSRTETFFCESADSISRPTDAAFFTSGSVKKGRALGAGGGELESVSREGVKGGS